MTELTALPTPDVVIIGGGPAGLMAAEQLTQAGQSVALFDAMPSVGRKFLIAGVGGLNLTHAENFVNFLSRYAEHRHVLQPYLANFDAKAVRSWAEQLGVETFVGSSGRVFPKAMKASPLLRAWLAHLKQHGLQVHLRHRWLGWDADNNLLFATPTGKVVVPYKAVILALGGGSWRKLGSDGTWVAILRQRGIEIAPLKPANCGFLCDWSAHLKQQVAGMPLKSIKLSFTDQHGDTETRQGELILTERGVEGSLIYAFSARLRDTIEAQGSACFYLDLCPQYTEQQLTTLLDKRNTKKSLSHFLKGSLKLDAAKVALVFEQLADLKSTATLASLLKTLPIQVYATTPIDEAISTAGGVSFSELDDGLMLTQHPGIFCAGEMLDWEAPTGGYLLNAVMATGREAGLAALQFIEKSVASA